MFVVQILESNSVEKLPTKSPFDEFLEELSASGSSTNTNVSQEEVTLETELQEYMKEKIPTSGNLLAFWQEKQKKYPRLYVFAALYCQVPFTEVDVERLFSNVSFLLHPLRLSMLASTINDIMIVRMNIKLFEDRQLLLSLSSL